MKNFDFNNMSDTELQKEINEISNIKKEIYNKSNSALSVYNHFLSKRRVNPIKFAEAKREINFFESIKDKIDSYHDILMDEQNQRIDNEASE